MKDHIGYIDCRFVGHYQNKRQNEQHVADAIQLPQANLSLTDNLAQAKINGARFVILGIPEDIGPRANCGKGGADKAWRNFLPVLLNQQSNQYFNWRQCLLLGAVELDDLQKLSYQASCSDSKLETLRRLCQQVDDRVANVLQAVFTAGLEAVVIGGGHNNAYPIIKALNTVSGKAIVCANMDAHADFRAMEGRHSGNAFRYAYEHKYLSRYCVFGLHEQKNNQAALDALFAAEFKVYSFQRMFMQQSVSFAQALDDTKNYLASASLPTGIELDFDSLRKAEASAYSVSGFTLEQAVNYVYMLAQLKAVRYVHLCEGAPVSHDQLEHKSHDVGQILNQLVYSYLKARAA